MAKDDMFLSHGNLMRLQETTSPPNSAVIPIFDVNERAMKRTTRAEGVGVFGYTDLDENDRIEIWVENITDNSDVTALVGGLVSIVERPS